MGTPASIKIALAAGKFVMKPGGFKIEVNRDHTFAARGQERCGGGKKEGAAYATLVRIEGYGLHGCSGCQSEGAGLPKVTGKVPRFTQSMMLRRLSKMARHGLIVIFQDFTQRCLERLGRGFVGEVAIGK